jgi:hypothetical protein
MIQTQCLTGVIEVLGYGITCNSNHGWVGYYPGFWAQIEI